MAKKKTEKREYLASPKRKPKWTQKFIRRDDCWDVFSGKWERISPNRYVYHAEPRTKTGENFSVIGPPGLNEITMRVRFKILTESLKPPEGGAILCFHFKNPRNYYSYHFCLCKQKIEFIKRFQGEWSTIAERGYKFEINKDYDVSIVSSSGFHQCHIDGVPVIKKFDSDISRGRIGFGTKYCDVECSHFSMSG